MEKIKNIIKLSSTSTAGVRFQPLSEIPASPKIRSILEVIGKKDHLCFLNEDGGHLAVLELQTQPTVGCPPQEEVQRPGKSQDKSSNSSQSWKKDKPQFSNGDVGKKRTVIVILDLQRGRCSNLGSIEGWCSVAVFHAEAPLLAVLQPPRRIHIFHVDRKCCSEVIELSDARDTLLGVQWLPRFMSGTRQSRVALTSERPFDRTSGGAASSSYDPVLTSGLLSFSTREVIVFRSPAPSERLPVEPSVLWAGAVVEGAAVVRETGAVDLLPLTGGPLLPLPLPSGAAPHLPVVAVCLLPCLKVLLLVLRGWCVVRCDVQERTTSLITLDTPASPAALRSAVALNSSHPLYPQVVLVLDSDGAVRVLSAQCWSCLRTVQSPSLTVEGMVVSNGEEFLCLTYSNHTSKLYRLSSLLPRVDGPVKVKSSSNKENTPGATRPEDSVPSKSHNTPASRDPSETDAPHRVRFSEVVQNAGTTKASLDRVKRAASHPDWRKLLSEFGSFPREERAAIWCGLLQLPRCAALHSNLTSKVLHSAVPLYDSMTDQALRGTFRRTLSCLYYWAPQLCAVPWVPSFVFPFVKSLQHAPLICFELCVSLLVSWCRLWFSPAPDVLVPPVLNTVEVLVCNASPRLMAALLHAHVTAHTYAWPLLTTAFAQVLSAEDWLVAWDHLLCRPPSFLLCFTAAYTLCLAPAIRAAAADQPKHIESLYSQESYVPVRALLKRAAELHASMKLDGELLQRLDAVTLFPEGGLPVFPNIPDLQAVDPGSAAGDGGALHSLGWSLDEVEFERERAALQQREERCIAAIRRVRRQHLGLS